MRECGNEWATGFDPTMHTIPLRYVEEPWAIAMCDSAAANNRATTADVMDGNGADDPT